jgi:hypothetical protein
MAVDRVAAPDRYAGIGAHIDRYAIVLTRIIINVGGFPDLLL